MRNILLLALSIIAPTIGLSDPLFRGTVTDASEAAISNAMVFIHWDSAGSTVGVTSNVGIKQDLVIRTEADGTFKVELPPGFYDVFVAATAFSPVCRKIRMKPGKALEIELRMNVDPLYSAEMGDRIEAAPPKR